MREIKFRVWSISKKGNNGTMHYLNNENSMKDLVEDERWKVMQFTGLLDKNGKEIYEGDLVKQLDAKKKRQGYVCIVDWREYQTGFHPFTGTRVPDGRWEIIGNIYENKELLK